jgi:hypothetical protein
MKVGILTILPRNNNYGGILQGYALMTALKKAGYQSFLISRVKDELSLTGKLKLSVKKILNKKQYSTSNQEYISKNMRYFEDKYLVPATPIIDSPTKFEIVDKFNFDAVIVGSDQVWRKAYNDDRKANFFLDFVDGSKTKKISYAASFGVDTWDYTEEETKKYTELLKKFHAVSVREDSGVTLCEKYLNTNAVLVVDPTLLLHKSDYTEVIKNENLPTSPGELLFYTLHPDADREQAIDKISGFFNYKPFSVNRKGYNLDFPLEDRVFPHVAAWLKGFDDAKFIFTDSFHGCVFSIIFNVPFIAYGNNKAGMARFYSLLKIFGLEDRLVLNSVEVTDEKLNTPFDWEKINAIVAKKRTEGFDFLRNAINS